MPSRQFDRTHALASISCQGSPSTEPLRQLSSLLDAHPGQWPVFELQCCFARVWKHLPEHIKASNCSETEAKLVQYAEQQMKASYQNILDLYPQSEASAIIDAQSNSSLSHHTLSRFIRNFTLPCQLPANSKRIALALPNGPLLGLAILATTTYYTCCPLSIASGVEQFRSDLAQSGASIVFVTAADVNRLGLDAGWARGASVEVVVIEQTADMTFSMQCSTSPSRHQQHGPTPNSADDVALMLFTSGTSGTKKTVPITLHALVCGIAFVIESWGLRSDDVCLNMMPLYHVGGIVRNLLAPIMAGGATICCAAFDANSFWDIVDDHGPTWYYASPTMHQMILDASKYRQESLEKSKMRLICNAAGGLLPSLACNLRDTFRCIVLPSYGMTECMPISSPPLTYQLDRPGTSGISVGPDLAILDVFDKIAAPGEVGRIAVRGAPLFGGYLKASGIIDKSVFTSSGFFDTGDLGYLDADGYLFVTGRSKEVINRGGELISPFEVEEAILSASQRPGSSIEGRISAVLAFSMPHDVLQETVGLVVVTPPNAFKVCLKTIRAAVKDSLSQVKWPQVLVYMEDLPKNNNKILRINLAKRMSMQDLSDDVLVADRHYTAVCPPPNTPLSESITTSRCLPDVDIAGDILVAVTGSKFDIYVGNSKNCGYPEAVIARNRGSPVGPMDATAYDLNTLFGGKVDDLNMPVACHVLEAGLPLGLDGYIDKVALRKMITGTTRSTSSASGSSETEAKICSMFANILSCPMSDLNGDSDFFELGGDSLRAGRLLSELRREFNARFPIDLLFTSGQVSAIAEHVDSVVGTSSSTSSTKRRSVVLEPVIAESCSSTNPLVLLVQLIPIIVLYPMKRALAWTIFLYVLAETQFWFTTHSIPGRLLNLMISMTIGRLTVFLIAPIVGISMKWLLIGRYRAGMYPMWGFYHTRWWLVQKILSVCGRGHFGMNSSSLNMYYRLLGAKIGTGATISPFATLGEYDLVEIGDYANLDNCICRGFAVERNTTMYLDRVRVGVNASVGLKSIVAPGTSVPDNACIGPNSSSWEIDDANEANRNYSSSKLPTVNFFLETLTYCAFGAVTNSARLIPWIIGLIGLVINGVKDIPDKVMAVIDWFAEPYRIAFHYLAVLLHAYFGPMAWFLALVIVKHIIDIILGTRSTGTAAGMSLRQRLRMTILRRVNNLGRLHSLIDLFGSHYESTSIIYRLLGAQVGKRVYWPGSGPSIHDFDLLNVGDDVVFGSRSHILTSDGNGSDIVKIGKAAMVSDRVVVLPGAHIGEGSVLGSGALTRRDKFYTEGTVWVGSRGGEAVCLSDTKSRRVGVTHAAPRPIKSTDDLNRNDLRLKKGLSVTVKAREDSDSDGSLTPTTNSSRSSVINEPTHATPFGRAFYAKLAPYRVWSLSFIMFYSSFITIFTTFYWAAAPTSSIQMLARLMPLISSAVPSTSAFRPFVIYIVFTACLSVLQTSLALLALTITISAKWLVIGRRTPGNYDWDKSSYCQRWQLYLTIERLRRHCYGHNGLLGLLTGTHYMVMYFRLLGAKIGDDCALFAGGQPSCLLTEPDLVTLGDRVAVDDASLVGHINSRGVFDLNELKVGSGAVLRSNSRLLSGASMGDGAVLLEHTLVMAGDHVEAGVVRQGWPSEEFEGRRMPGLAMSTSSEKV